MEVERKTRVQGVARLLTLGVDMRKDNSAELRFPFPSVDALNAPFSFTGLRPLNDRTVFPRPTMARTTQPLAFRRALTHQGTSHIP